MMYTHLRGNEDINTSRTYQIHI